MAGPNTTGVLIRRERFGHRYNRYRGRPHENRGRRELSTNQRERPTEKNTLLTPGYWTSGIHNCQEINVCCLSYPVCGTLLQLPQQTSTLDIKENMSMDYQRERNYKNNAKDTGQ